MLVMSFLGCLAATAPLTAMLPTAPAGTRKQRDKVLIVLGVIWVGWRQLAEQVSLCVNVKWRYTIVIKPSRYNLIPENSVGKALGTLEQANFVIRPQTKLASFPVCDWWKQNLLLLPFVTKTYANISTSDWNLTNNSHRKEADPRQWNSTCGIKRKKKTGSELREHMAWDGRNTSKFNGDAKSIGPLMIAVR